MDPQTNDTPAQLNNDSVEPTTTPPVEPTEQAAEPLASAQPQVAEPEAATTPEVVPVQPVYSAPTQTEVPQEAPGKDPGQTLAIISIVLAFFFTIAGLIVAIIAKSKSKKAGFKNTLATVSIVLNSVFLVLSIIATIFIVSLALPAIKSRAVAVNFSSAIRQGDVDAALQYAEVESTDKDSIKAYFLALSKAIGESQKEVDSATVDDTQVFVYEVTNGSSKYYKVVVKGDKVINASTSDTQLTADTGEPDEIIESE